jgi:UDP-GlcNAc3NAcA epimerase
MDAGVIGTGVMGRNHVRVYSELKEVGTTYVYDLNTKAAEEVAAATGAEVCRSMEELLRKAECVSVVVPTPYHLQTAGEVIAAGVHTLIEKPLCLTVRECEQLIGQIPEGLTVGVGHIERFNPVVTEVARVVQDPLYVSFHRHNPASARVSGFGRRGPDDPRHRRRLQRPLPGREYTVHASGTGDVAAALAAFGRTPVYLSASRKSSKKVRSVYIEEEDRTIEGDFMTQEVYVYRKARGLRAGERALPPGEHHREAPGEQGRAPEDRTLDVRPGRPRRETLHGDAGAGALERPGLRGDLPEPCGMKVLSVVGARPQFVKCAPVSRELRKVHEEVLVHTGQHYDYLLSEVFFRDLGIPAPDYHLDIGSGSHGVQTGRMLAAIEEVIGKEEPEIVLVYGDTNSTLAGALAAAKVHVPVAHVEAGLRSFDRRMPEEVNRVLTDHCSDLLFCPTATAVANLAAEGVTAGVHLTGDVMVDALQQNLPLAKERSTALIDLGLSPKGYFLATVHRASNTDDPAALRAIMDAFARLDAPVVFPVHPRTRKKFAEYGIAPAANVSVVEPLPYFDMLALLSGARAVLTDSGGVQKEAYILEVPCVTLRENTEWVETLEDGWNVLVGADADRIVAEADAAGDARRQHAARFGDGHAAARIAAIIRESEP